MSDSENVTFNDKQFARVDMHLQAITNALRGIKTALEKGDNRKLDEIIEMLQAQNEMLEEHIKNGGGSGADQAKLDEATQTLKSSTDALDSVVKANQPPAK